MRKTFFLLGLPVALLLSSCANFTIHDATNNPMGTKSGVAKAMIFSSDADFSYNKAAKKGGVNKIGATEIRRTLFGMKTTVYGE